jgi:hypothetical protein
MNEPLRPLPLTPDSSPPVDPTFTPARDRPSAYRTSGWEAKDKRWKGWPAVVIGLLVGAMVIGANYQTKRKAEEREAIAAAQVEAPMPTTPTEPTTPSTTPDATAQAPASPEQVLKEAPPAAGPAATPKREATRAPATEHRNGAATSQRAAQPNAPVLKPAEPIVSVPTPSPTPAAPAAEAKPPVPDPLPAPAPAPQPEQQPPSQ